MDNELLKQVSFSLDLLNLDRKLMRTNASVHDEGSNSLHLVEEALRTNGVRATVDQKAKQ